MDRIELCLCVTDGSHYGISGTILPQSMTGTSRAVARVRDVEQQSFDFTRVPFGHHGYDATARERCGSAVELAETGRPGDRTAARSA
jgi:hypothetical protein